MILRFAGTGAPAPSVIGGRRPSSLSPGLMAAVGLSLVVHIALGVYLYTHRFAPIVLVTPPDKVIDIRTYRFAPADPIKPPPIDRTPVVKPRPTPFTDPTHMADPLPIPADPPKLFDPPQTPAKDPEPAKPAPPRAIVQPHWLSLPTADQLMGAYPQRALELGKAGTAVLSCAVTATGAVHDCAVTSETPAGFGFGAAAQKLQRYFRMTPKTEDGQAVEGGVVSVSIRFSLAD